MLIPCQAALKNVEGVETRINGLEQIMKSVRWKWLPSEAPNSFDNLILNCQREIDMRLLEDEEIVHAIRNNGASCP